MIHILTPTVRPSNARRLAAAVEATVSGRYDVTLWLGVDHGQGHLYRDIPTPAWSAVRVVEYPDGFPRTLSAMTNQLEIMIARETVYQDVYNGLIIGSLGDDHLPETRGWDEMVVETIAAGALGVYGDDGFQHDRLPTAIFLSGWAITHLYQNHVMHPKLRHMYVDNYWRDTLGQRLVYIPEMKITHLHPFATGQEMDASYTRTNNELAYSLDRAAYATLVGSGHVAEVAERATQTNWKPRLPAPRTRRWDGQ